MESTRTARPRRTADLRVDAGKVPGWVTGVQRLPVPGERVYTHEGTAVVARILGRTSSGGRLLELSMDDGRRHPFFAAAANVMVRPDPESDDPSQDTSAS